MTARGLPARPCEANTWTLEGGLSVTQQAQCPSTDAQLPFVDSSDFSLAGDPKGRGGSVIKTPALPGQVPETKGQGGARCEYYCRTYFNHEGAGGATVQDAPDSVRGLHPPGELCMWCAGSMLSRNMSRTPRRETIDPCSYDTAEREVLPRWMALIALSFLAPCVLLPASYSTTTAGDVQVLRRKHKAADGWFPSQPPPSTAPKGPSSASSHLSPARRHPSAFQPGGTPGGLCTRRPLCISHTQARALLQGKDPLPRCSVINNL